MRNYLAVCSEILSEYRLNSKFCISSNSRVISFLLLGGLPAGVEDYRAHVGARFGPLVALLGQHGADEPDDGSRPGEDADDVGTAADLLVEPPLGLLDQAWRQTSQGMW